MASTKPKGAGPRPTRDPEQVPKQFWDDQEWALDNYAELSGEFPDQWIAVVDRRVVCHGKNIDELRRTARSKTRRKHIPILFVEGAVQVY